MPKPKKLLKHSSPKKHHPPSNIRESSPLEVETAESRFTPSIRHLSEQRTAANIASLPSSASSDETGAVDTVTNDSSKYLDSAMEGETGPPAVLSSQTLTDSANSWCMMAHVPPPVPLTLGTVLYLHGRIEKVRFMIDAGLALSLENWSKALTRYVSTRYNTLTFILIAAQQL